MYTLYKYLKLRYFLLFIWYKYWLALSITLFLHWIVIRVVWEIIK